jgi:lipid A 3-O-deacylase
MNAKSQEQINRRGETTMNFRRVCQWAGCVCGLAGLLLASALVNPSSAYGEDQTIPPLTLSLAESTPSTPRSIWKDGVGNGFREDTFDAGFALGAGFGTKVFGSSQTHDLALASGSFGWVFTDVVAEDKWWRGNWEWLNELFSGGQFNDKSRYFVGAMTGLRYNFATGTRWVPFVDGGVGLSGTDMGRPDLGQPFEFNVQAGVGGMSDVNKGVNTQMFEGGITWFF